MNNGSLNQEHREIALHPHPCENCGEIAVMAILTRVIKQGSAVLIPSMNQSGPQQARVTAEGKSAHAMCLSCGRREKWVAENGNWNKTVVFNGDASDDASGPAT